MGNRIFVSVASYRDPDLATTIVDLVANAARPERLVIAVLEQDFEPLSRSAFPHGVTLIHDSCKPEESLGTCWARTQIQKRFDGEAFYFQLDSHHRFAPGWDSALQSELARCPSGLPVLSGYLPPFAEKDGADWRADDTGGALHASHFDHDGVLHIKSHQIAGDPTQPPVRGHYVSGHFIFAPGEFVRRVPYDPDFYFTGEEVSMSVRAFTHGFDVFHPRKAVAWHRYGREVAPRHWNDHPEGSAGSWTEAQRKSVAKWTRLFGPAPHIADEDGLGWRRSLADFEAWSGVDCHWRMIHPSALAASPPPCGAPQAWAVEAGQLQSTTIKVPLPDLEGQPLESVYVALRDSTPRDAFVRRVGADEYAALRSGGLELTVFYKTAPLTLVVLPFADGKWGAAHEKKMSTQ